MIYFKIYDFNIDLFGVEVRRLFKRFIDVVFKTVFSIV
jgi:hypothetical protein